MSNQDQERNEDFGVGSFDDFVEFFDALLHSIVPEVGYELDVDNVPQKAIFVNINLDDPGDIGLVIGRGALNINILQLWMRAQQIYPQDRYVHIKLHGAEDDDVQWFSDKNIRKEFDYKIVRECQLPDDSPLKEQLFGHKYDNEE